MKTIKSVSLKPLFLIIALFLFTNSIAQIIDPKKEAGAQAELRANSNISNGIDDGLDKVEDGIKNLFKKNKNKDQSSGNVQEDEPEPEPEQNSSEISEEKQLEKPTPQKIESYTQYDFVPGDKILYYEDFSQDAIGDFPVLWTTNGSAEVKTLNIAPGNWFHMNGMDAVYCYTNSISFPANFIVEFDIIPDEEFEHGIQLSFYQESEPKELTDALYPGDKGLNIELKADGWETLGYNNIDDNGWLMGQSQTAPVVKEQVNHFILWVQNRRVRIYHQGKKTLDMPTNIYAGTVFNKFRFSGWDRYAYPYISNIKITTASPDTRSKLITEGKLVSYGINFDSGKDVVKPESYGSVKEIAKVLSEAPDVRILIVGHTDGEGDDANNLELSKRRAASVKNFLAASFGIDAGRIETSGKGESEPIEPNTTSEGKAKNRRVEFIKL